MRSLIWVIMFVVVAGFGSPIQCRADSPAPPPLPTLPEIFRRVQQRGERERENDRTFDARFYFVKTRLTETRNGKGELKKHEEKISTNNPALKKLAKPPPPAPANAPEKEPAASERQTKERGKAYEKEEFEVNDDLLSRFEYTILGRETFNGRSAIVVEFVPAKGKLPERSLKDKFINRTAGRVWLDEEDYAMAKLTLRLTDRVNVVGGLVGAVNKFNFCFERVRTEDGLWYSRDVTWRLEGREVFSQRLMDFHETRTQVRRME